MNNGPKSRAFYRIQATRKMMGSGNIMRKISERAQSDLSEVKAELQRVDVDVEEEPIGTKICFEPGHYTVMESCGEFEMRVVRTGDLSHQSTVEYVTEVCELHLFLPFIFSSQTIATNPKYVQCYSFEWI